MSISSKNYNSLVIIIFSLITGYLMKLLILPYSNYKILFLCIYFLFMYLHFAYISFRKYTLLLFSFIIFIIEFNAATTVPFLIHLSEAGIKVLSPFIALLIIRYNKYPEYLIKTGICFTFIAHGLLALNIIPTPAVFYQMTEKILNLNFEQSRLFLDIFGFLDILACFILIFTKKYIYKLAVFYCIIWGGITALARTIYLFDLDIKTLFFSGIAETLVRIPNSLLPFLLLYRVNKKSKTDYL